MDLSPADIARFWRMVDTRDSGQCWPWKGATGMGYGRLKISGRLYSAHRLAFLIANGPIPEGDGYHGTVVRHACDNKACCNPAHLTIGSQRDNCRDTGSRNRAGPKNLSPEIVASIRSDARAQKVIATEFGVAESTVWKIRTGRLHSIPHPTEEP